MMAVNQDRKKRNSKSYKNCPRAILNVVPNNCTKIKFCDLVPGEDYQHKAIIGKVDHLYPIGKRKDGHIRKILITDALGDSEDSEKKLTVFLLDQFAVDSDATEVEGFIIMTNFIVENLTHHKTDDLPVQILVKKDESQVWFCRKVNTAEKRKSSEQKKQKLSDEEESHAVTSHHYEYTKLGDLVESDNKESYNVYGIVDKCDLKITQGKKLQILDLLLTDQTETGFSCSVFGGAGETFPDIYPGDIVRIHRMQVHKFRNKLKGRCPNPKFILVFSKNSEGDKPRTVAKTFTFTPEDIVRFRELLEWYKSKSDPKLICDIKKDDFANIICQVIGVYIAKTTDAVILKIWDGTKTNEFPGVHLGMKEEKLDQRLFAVARHYYVVLSVYGHHTAIAAELEPGQYIEVGDAHLYSPRDNPDDSKLCIHAGSKEGRGITVLTDNDERVIILKQRLEKIINDTLEFGNQTDYLLSQNNSMFLNCDISVFNSAQNVVNGEASTAANELPNENSEPTEEQVAENDDIILLNEPLVKDVTPCENAVVSVVNASIKPGQSTQEFGLGMPRDGANTLDDENRFSTASEPDPLCNLTPLQTRFFFHDPQRSVNQMTDSIFPTYASATQDEWWNSTPTVSVTDQHSNVKPSTLNEVVQHSVPYKFRVLAAVFSFKPNSNCIQNFIHLCCPKCLYISEDVNPAIEPFEIKDGLSYYFCPRCSENDADQEKWPVLEHTFLVSLSLHDGSGPPFVEAYIWRDNAVKFFKGITPEDALRDSAIADSILHMLWTICPNCRPFNSNLNEYSSVYPILDCCILSYNAENNAFYQMFDTILL